VKALTFLARRYDTGHEVWPGGGGCSTKSSMSVGNGI
jgi:hypothetical protein